MLRSTPDHVLQQELHGLVQRWNRESAAIFDRQQQRGNRFITPPPTLSEELAEQTFQALQGWVLGRSPHPVALTRQWALHWGWGGDPRQLLRPLLVLPELSLLHFVRLMVVLGEIDPATTTCPQRYRTIGHRIDAYLRRYRASHAPPCGLHELAQAFTAAGLDDRCLGRARLLSEHRRPRLLMEADATWPYFAARPGLLGEALLLPADEHRFDRRTRRVLRHNALDIIAMMPAPPDTLHELLWQIALDGNQAERIPAQVALERLGDQRSALVAVLGGTSRWQQRAAAADWLGRAAGRATGEARSRAATSLRQALRGESSRRVRAVLCRRLRELQPDPEPAPGGDSAPAGSGRHGSDRRDVSAQRQSQP